MLWPQHIVLRLVWRLFIQVHQAVCIKPKDLAVLFLIARQRPAAIALIAAV
jgi:hypothetical protein